MDEDMEPASNHMLDGEEQEKVIVLDEDDHVDNQQQQQQEKKVQHAVYAHAPMQPCSQTLASPEPTLVEQLSSTPSPGPNPVRAEEEEEEEEDDKSFATPASDQPSSNSSQESPMQNHHKRFLQLQAFLKLCDEADQNELLQALGSLSAAARSGHAFNLEYRALMLSMEEGREMLRLKMLNVMGGRGKDEQTSTPGSTPEGSRLPAPGSIDLGD